VSTRIQFEFASAIIIGEHAEGLRKRERQIPTANSLRVTR